MLTSPKEEPGSLIFTEAQLGDKFYLVDFSTLTRVPVSVTLLTVERAGKRDIVCWGNSLGIERRIKRDCRLRNAYLTREEVIWAIDAIRVYKKQLAAWKAIQTHKIEAITEDLADRIIAWGKVLEAGKEKSHE